MAKQISPTLMTKERGPLPHDLRIPLELFASQRFCPWHNPRSSYSGKPLV